MFVWIAIFAYFLFAINAVIDKFLLQEKRIGQPATYAFAIGILSLVVLVLVPFGFFIPAFDEVLLSLMGGSFFTLALLAFFTALKGGEASRIVPQVSGFIPFFTLVLAYILIGERLTSKDFLAFATLAGGTLLLSGTESKKRERGEVLIFIGIASVLFAFSFTITKAVFEQLGFINGFIWTRFGMAATAILLLLDPRMRREIFGQIRKGKQETGIWFLSGQVIGALGGFAQNYAIALGSVTIVNALAGTQFVFLLALSIFLSLWYPNILQEKISKTILIQKVLAIIFISIGVAIFAV